MKFPDFVEDPQQNDKERAIARLKYMLNNAAARVCPRATISALARHCGIDNSTLLYGLRKGRLTDRVAVKLQDGVGKGPDGQYILRYEDLRFPERVGQG